MRPPDAYEPALYNTAVARAFRAEAKRHTRRFTKSRRFLNRVADALNSPGRKRKYARSGIATAREYLYLEPTRTWQRWNLVKTICHGVSGIRWELIEKDFFLAIMPIYED